MKAVAFQKLFETCDKNGQLKIIVENLKNIEQVSQEWKLSLDEKRQLLKSCAVALDKNNETEGAFRVMTQFLRLFEKSNNQELAQHNVD